VRWPVGQDWFVVEVPEQVADQLYAVPPRRFVAAREAAVARARAAGQGEVAQVIAGLRRPTVAAWLVNLLALHRPEQVAELAELSEALREAQRERRGGTLRDLSARRRSVVSALVRTAEALARETDAESGGAKLPLAEVESTLTAAVADPGVAAQVRAGRLQRAAQYAGFGGPGGPGGLAGAGDDRSASRTGAAGTAPQRAAGLARAREAVAAAEAELSRTAGVRRGLAGQLADIDATLADLGVRRTEVTSGLARAQAAETAARRAVERAGRRLAAVEAEGGGSGVNG
jgi:hypothetical protein